MDNAGATHPSLSLEVRHSLNATPNSGMQIAGDSLLPRLHSNLKTPSSILPTYNPIPQTQLKTPIPVPYNKEKVMADLVASEAPPDEAATPVDYLPLAISFRDASPKGSDARKFWSDIIVQLTQLKALREVRALTLDEEEYARKLIELIKQQAPQLDTPLAPAALPPVVIHPPALTPIKQETKQDTVKMPVNVDSMEDIRAYIKQLGAENVIQTSGAGKTKEKILKNLAKWIAHKTPRKVKPQSP